MRWWPRSIRWQMLVGLALLEAFSIGLFAILLSHLQRQDIHRRAEQRLLHQADSVVREAQEGFRLQRTDAIALAVQLMAEAPSVARVHITDPAGATLFEQGEQRTGQPLDAAERAQIPQLKAPAAARVFTAGKERWESVKPIYVGSTLYGYAWIESDPA